MIETTVTQEEARLGVDRRAKTFEGWAIVDVLGHQRHAGYVTTEYFGQTAMFRVMTPARPTRDRVVVSMEFPSGWGSIPSGATVTEGPRDGSLVFIGSGVIYQITPTTEAKVLDLLDEIDPRTILSAKDVNGTPIEKPKRGDDDYPF